MNVLYGLYEPDDGEILLNGKPIQLKNARDAIALGLGMVHQHFMLVQRFTVAEISFSVSILRASLVLRIKSGACAPQGIIGSILFVDPP